jgi:CRP-like cAMP-binding protein
MLAAPNQMDALVKFFNQGTKLVYAKGEFVIRPGGAPSGIFYIESGLVEAYDITKYGEENLLIIRKQGDLLGLTWAVTGENRHIIYTAIAPTVVWQVSRDQFTEFVRSNPSVAIPLVDMLVDMYRLHSERILNLEYRTVRERLVSFLITTARRFGRKTPEGMLLDVPLRHQDIASSISATRETTGRELAILERQGLLEQKNSFILIHDVQKLRSYLE